MSNISSYNLLLPLDISISVLGFKNLHKYLKNNYLDNDALINNYVSGFHALGTLLNCILCLKYNNNIWNVWCTRNFLTGYMLYDILYILMNKRYGIISFGYLYHHIITILFIFNNFNKYNIPLILMFAELSNLPGYLVYHKIKNNCMDICVYKRFQFINYLIIRIPILGTLGINLLMKTVKGRQILYLITPVYFMGVIWTILLGKQIHKN